MGYNIKEAEAYIRRAAQLRGMDPDIALKVARSEGLARGTWQSKYKHPKRGLEPSYGPFQLLVGGQNGWPRGIGNRMIEQTGINPADPANWRQGIDFGLDVAAKEGWGQWYGAKKVGVGNFDGIRGAKPMGMARAAAPAQQYAATPQRGPVPATAAHYPMAGKAVQAVAPEVAQAVRSGRTPAVATAQRLQPVATQVAQAAPQTQTMFTNMANDMVAQQLAAQQSMAAQHAAIAQQTNQQLMAQQASQMAAQQAASSMAAQSAMPAAKSPMGGIFGLMASLIGASQQPPAPPVVSPDAVEPGVGGTNAVQSDMDPYLQTALTSHTPNAYAQRERRRPRIMI